MKIIVTEKQILDLKRLIKESAKVEGPYTNVIPPVTKVNAGLMQQVVVGENIDLDINVGDTVMMGKFKNKKTVVKNIDKDKHGSPTINGKQATTFRTTDIKDKKEITEEIVNEITSNEVKLNSFEPQSNLNNKIWQDNENTIKSNIRKNLLKIADDFLYYINVDSKFLKDIIFLGSLANYNWSKYSDIDLHLLIDFSKINKDIELVTEYFDAKKKLWNEEHDTLKICGFPVELYVQDVKETNAATGVYSLERNKWIKKPPHITNLNLDKESIKKKSSDLMTQIDELNNRYKKNKLTNNIVETEKISKLVKKLFDKIKNMRKIGLETKEGELSENNIIFKVLRRTGRLETLIGLKQLTYDKINSIK